MFPSRLLIIPSIIVVLLTNASPNPRLAITITVDDSGFEKDAARPIAPQDQDFIDWYDCSGKENGDYYHPTDCHKFITCSNGNAAERDCPQCIVSPSKCPSGRLVFDLPSELVFVPLPVFLNFPYMDRSIPQAGLGLYNFCPDSACLTEDVARCTIDSRRGGETLLSTKHHEQQVVFS